MNESQPAPTLQRGERVGPIRVIAVKPSRSKYIPHAGAKEKARRLKQLAKIKAA